MKVTNLGKPVMTYPGFYTLTDGETKFIIRKNGDLTFDIFGFVKHGSDFVMKYTNNCECEDEELEIEVDDYYICLMADNYCTDISKLHYCEFEDYEFDEMYSIIMKDYRRCIA